LNYSKGTPARTRKGGKLDREAPQHNARSGKPKRGKMDNDLNYGNFWGRPHLGSSLERVCEEKRGGGAHSETRNLKTRKAEKTPRDLLRHDDQRRKVCTTNSVGKKEKTRKGKGKETN